MLVADRYGTLWAELPGDRLLVVLREADGWSISIQPAGDLHTAEPFARGLSLGTAQWRAYQELKKCPRK